MSNISLNGVVFPSPSVARQTQQLNSSSPVFSSPINCGTSTFKNYTQSTSSAVGIQFPSPYYTPSPISDPANLYMNSAMPSAASYQLPSIIMSSRCSEAGIEQPQVACTSSVWQQNVPSTLPWVVPGQSHSNLVQFTASTMAAVSNSLRQGTTRSPSSLSSLSQHQVNLRQSAQRRSPRKRRCDFSQERQHDSKVFIHEDRIAAGMRGLKLKPSGNNDPKPANMLPAKNEAWFVEEAIISDDDEMGDEDPETGEADCDMEPKLRFSHELEMGLKNKDLLPQMIREEISKSQMQVVLWKPPSNHVKSIVNGYQLNSESSSGKLLTERKPEIVSPNVWSIPEGQYNEDTECTIADSLSNRCPQISPSVTNTDPSNLALNSNNPSNFSQQHNSSAATSFNFTNSVLGNDTGKKMTQRSVKFDFSVGPDFWNHGNKGNDFVACSTPKDNSSDFSGFSSSNTEEMNASSLKTDEKVVPVLLNNGSMVQNQDNANLTVFDFIDDDMDL